MEEEIIFTIIHYKLQTGQRVNNNFDENQNEDKARF